MNEFSVWISIAALAISALALFQSRARYNAQARLSLEQQRYDLRLDFHLAALRIVDLTTRIIKEPTSSQIVAVAQNLADAGIGIADCHRRLRSLKAPPLLGTTWLESKFVTMRADATEILRVLNLSEVYLKEERIDDLQKAVEDIHRRVWAGSKKPNQPVVQPDRSDAAG